MMNKDQIIPKEKWCFDDKVANCFEDMLKRSIPQYDIMRQTVFNLGTSILHKVKGRPKILDIGCSDGLSLKDYLSEYNESAYLLGIDVSDPMINKAKSRFKKNKNVEILKMDLRNRFPFSKNKFSLIQSILSIQFIPIEYRQNIIQNIYNNLRDGGGFIMVEKVMGSCSLIDNIMVDEYLSLKAKNGYTEDQIDRKKLSLEGVLVPVTSDWNMDFLKQAGFIKIDRFWKWMNFEGYVAIK